MELNQENYEHYLLLYIDNELTAPQRAAVDAFLKANPTYAKELSALQNTLIHPEEIEYTDKKLLYRFEEMNAQLDPAFKKSLYKQTNSTATIIDFKKRYVAYASIAAVAIWIFIGVNQQTIPSISNAPVIASQNKIDIPKSETAPSLIQSEKQFTASSTKTYKQPNQVGTQEQSTTIEISSSSTAAPIVIAAQTEEFKQSAVETNKNESLNLENNSSLVAETRIEKESFEEINTDNNDRVIHFSNIELDGDKFRGITRRLGAIFKRNKNEKNK
ncbi:MAG: hypothetical protein RL387_406 [Bacteroidota bacterium]|jgi:hypothetical protein